MKQRQQHWAHHFTLDYIVISSSDDPDVLCKQAHLDALADCEAWEHLFSKPQLHERRDFTQRRGSIWSDRRIKLNGRRGPPQKDGTFAGRRSNHGRRGSNAERRKS